MSEPLTPIRPRSSRLRGRRSLVLLALALLASWGAAVVLSSRAGPPRLSVHVETLADGDGAFHRRWSFSGGGRWASYGVGTRGGEHFVVIDRPGSLDGGLVRFLKERVGRGADRIAYEVEARAVPGEDGVRIKRSLAGNDGGTPSFSTTARAAASEQPWRSRYEATLIEDMEVALPARLRLGTVGGLVEVIEFR